MPKSMSKLASSCKLPSSEDCKQSSLKKTEDDVICWLKMEHNLQEQWEYLIHLQIYGGN